MATRKSTTAAIAGLDAMTALLDPSGVLEIWEGTIPANCETAEGGTLLATNALTATAFGAAADGTNRATATAAHISDDVLVDNTGTAQFFRFKTSGGTCHFQGAVGQAPGAGEDLLFDNTSFIANGTATITDFFLLHLDE
jgi:hypothetical protein